MVYAPTQDILIQKKQFLQDSKETNFVNRFEQQYKNALDITKQTQINKKEAL